MGLTPVELRWLVDDPKGQAMAAVVHLSLEHLDGPSRFPTTDGGGFSRIRWLDLAANSGVDSAVGSAVPLSAN